MTTVRRYAQRLLASLPADHVEALRTDPIRAITAAGLQVRPVPALIGQGARRAGAPGRWCDGLTLHEQGVILVAPTSDSRRQWFTLLHEYAHILADNDDEIVDWLADRPHRAVDLEALCDEIAGRLLIPDKELDAVIGAGPIRARHLQDLHRRNPYASQMACAVGLARRLPCAGAVVLTDRAEHRVVFAATNGELQPRPRRNTAVPDAHPLRRLTPDAPLTAVSYWSEPWGGDRRTLYLDATASPRRTYSIMLVDDIWSITTFHHESRETIAAERPSQRRRCRCGVDKVIYGWPCVTYGVIPCPTCGRCDCARRDAMLVRCTKCTVSYPPRALTDGRCPDCC